MNIKRMNLQFYMEDEDIFMDLLSDSQESKRYLEIEPILNREGIYKRGKECWFEIRGKAYVYPVETFDFEFSLINTPSLSSQELNALKAIVSTKFSTKKQQELYRTICYNIEHFHRRLENYKFMKKFD